MYHDGETIFDRNAVGGAYPSLTEIREMRKTVRGKLAVPAG